MYVLFRLIHFRFGFFVSFSPVICARFKLWKDEYWVALIMLRLICLDKNRYTIHVCTVRRHTQNTPFACGMCAPLLAIIHSGIDWCVFSVELRNICYLFWKFVALSHFVRVSYGSRFITGKKKEKRPKIKRTIQVAPFNFQFALEKIWKAIVWPNKSMIIDNFLFDIKKKVFSVVKFVTIKYYTSGWNEKKVHIPLKFRLIVRVYLVLWKRMKTLSDLYLCRNLFIFFRHLKLLKQVNCEENTIFRCIQKKWSQKNIQFRSKENLYIRDHTCACVRRMNFFFLRRFEYERSQMNVTILYSMYESKSVRV